MSDYGALVDDLREMEYRAMLTIAALGQHDPRIRELEDFATECFVFRCDVQFRK